MKKTKLTSWMQNKLTDKEDRNLLINIGLAFVVKGASLFISVFSMPLYMRYFDNDQILGFWFTVLSMLSWISMCDLGFGNGLRNRFTEAYTLGDLDRAGEYVSSTYASLSAIMLPVAIIGSFAVCHLDLNAFFQIPDTTVSLSAMRTATSVLLVGIACRFIFQSINSVIYAIQKSALTNFISLFVSAIPLAYILIMPSGSQDQNIVQLSVVHALAQNLPFIVATVLIYTRKSMRQCRPAFSKVHVSVAKQMLNFGVQFFAAQAFFMILMSTNELFITRLFSAEYVVEYSIYYKLFTIIGSLFMLALTPLWSKVTMDLANRRYDKIQQTNRLLYLISLFAFVVELLIVPFLQIAINIWLGDQAITVNYLTAAIFAIYGGVYIFNIVLTTVANGMGELRTQIVFYGIGAVLKFPVCMFLRTITDNWIVVIIYNSVILLIFCFYQFFWVRKKLKTMSSCNL